MTLVPYAPPVVAWLMSEGARMYVCPRILSIRQPHQLSNQENYDLMQCTCINRLCVSEFVPDLYPLLLRMCVWTHSATPESCPPHVYMYSAIYGKGLSKVT